MENPTILHVEDDDDAAFFLKRAVDKAGLHISLKRLKDGDEAVRYLDVVGLSADRSIYPIPRMVLLDLKMPLKDGFEVLQWIKQQPYLASIPVVVLTSSDRQEDVRLAKSSGATSYVTKTVSFGNVITLLRTTLQGT